LRFGSYLIDVGDSQTAKRYLNWALELDPSDKRARAALTALEVTSKKISHQSDPPVDT